jgi:hypothetical protein
MKNLLEPEERTARFLFPRLLGIALLIVGIVTAALDATFGGFAPILWFLLALAVFMILICMEVLRIRTFLESKK